ncbi:transcriptional regulator, DeoR family [Desulfotomaculum arcticum]|uniref:Transcriptional regulator, DeoR family n=1 Tax=Desulfotruncus arcticus DSM 17038 TaxID=1121424 RepID=A0A1I2VXJ2_9FIRM|nr:DeoR/GlpR family DNA-binding transcription regulator [Desulfotruncus arcticus]SFG93109.1 transcriptional regulator, DeoR family [Desulfotomaculum arcticum] [Desulfotruncus arcticus DSM 17038]
MTLLAEERKRIILKTLDTYGKVTVKNLSATFNVSTETIRRDLDALESNGMLKKVYGGAIELTFDGPEHPHKQREKVYLEEKKAIGKAAAALVNDNEIIALDYGTTTIQIIPNLKNKKNLTVLTNSVPALTLLIDYKNKNLFSGKIIYLGGEINSSQMSSFGPITEKMLKEFYVDKAFIGIGGISIKHGITEYDINEGVLSKKMIGNAKESIIVADHSKIGVRQFYKIADIDLINAIVCDQKPPDDWTNDLIKSGIKWITPL